MLICSDAEPIHSGNRLNQKCPLITNSYLEKSSSKLVFKSDWILFPIRDLKVNNQPQNRAPAPPTKNQTPKPNQPTKTPAAKPKPGGATKKPTGPKEHIDETEFSPEELQDPDHINCLQTLMVLDFKINKYQEKSNKIDGRTPYELRQRIVKMKCKKQSLTDSLGDDISPEDYLLLLKTTFAHDKRLVDYFNQQKDAEKSKLVSERLPLII